MTARPYVGNPSPAPASTGGTSPSTIVSYTSADLATQLGIDPARAAQLFSVAALQIEEYAPRAPAPMKVESLLRFAGYLLDAGTGAVQEETFGPKSLKFVTNHAAMFRNSGAEALLTRYKRRRGGKV